MLDRAPQSFPNPDSPQIEDSSTTVKSFKDRWKLLTAKIQFAVLGNEPHEERVMASNWYTRLDSGNKMNSSGTPQRLPLFHGKTFEWPLFTREEIDYRASSEEGVEVLFSGKSKTIYHLIIRSSTFMLEVSNKLQTRKIFSVQVFIINHSTKPRRLKIRVPPNRDGSTVFAK